MEQQTPKFRLRLNFFDSIVLLLALLAGAFLLWRAVAPHQAENVAIPQTHSGGAGAAGPEHHRLRPE